MKARGIWLGVLVGVVLGFYDGFFGPGTGSFLILIFASFFGFEFLVASGSAKVINWATNLASVIYFVSIGQVLYKSSSHSQPAMSSAHWRARTSRS